MQESAKQREIMPSKTQQQLDIVPFLQQFDSM